MNVGNSAIKLAKEKGYIVDESGIVWRSGRVIQVTKSRDGRSRFRIRDSRGKVVNIPVHRLIGYQKFGDIIFNVGMQVRHLDDDYTNNSMSNIDVGTQSDNMMDVPPDVRLSRAKHAASFNSNKVMAGGVIFDSYTDAAKHFGISDNGIRKRIKLRWDGYKKLH